MRTVVRSMLPIVMLVTGCAGGTASTSAREMRTSHSSASGFSISTGQYIVSFKRSAGAITVKPKGSKAALSIVELGGVKKSNVLSAATSVKHSGTTYTVKGKASWASFVLKLSLSASISGLLHVQLKLNPTKDAPTGTGNSPDVRLIGTSAPLLEYAPAAPVAGNAVYLGSSALTSTILYFSNYTGLGPYFNLTKSGASQANFTYPGAEGLGSLVGSVGSAFGYEPPSGSVDNLPHKKSTLAVDSYLYLLPGLPTDEVAQADTYLRMISAIDSMLPQPADPAADWPSIAAKAAQNLADPANLVTLNGFTYLRSYVSDTRTAPELITQAGVLAGIEAYEKQQHVTVPLAATLDAGLPQFYDSTYHTVTNQIGHNATARDESWYYVDNLISLLQLAQLGDATATTLLKNSIDSAIALAHANNYEFPVTFQYGVWSGGASATQPDVAGGYAWLMLGMYDLTSETRYLDEAKASIAHVAGKGFNLAYELHMTAYTAAAAQRLFTMTGDSAYHGEAELALANLFHATRLWDCTYGLCIKDAGYHTYMGLDPLPTGDYVAMLEQYEAWLGLRDYAQYDKGEPAYITDLVQAFLTYTPNTMQYALPPQLPSGAAATSPGLYDFVKSNNLTWDIPLEDLREGELTSGAIGQEIYGAGGPFMFAAYG
jgi:hypothetical protein